MSAVANPPTMYIGYFLTRVNEGTHKQRVEQIVIILGTSPRVQLQKDEQIVVILGASPSVQLQLLG
jgi:hypothetical protein